MIALMVAQHHIGGALRVELVDLVLTIDHRHLPAEQIDEDFLARPEHGGERRLSGARARPFDNNHLASPSLLDAGMIERGGGGLLSQDLGIGQRLITSLKLMIPS